METKEKFGTLTSGGTKITSWQMLEGYFQDLEKRPLESVADLKEWLHDRSILSAVLEEDMGWRYIKMSCDTENKALAEEFNFFVTEISPNVAPYDDSLNRKLVNCPFTAELDEATYGVMLRSVKKQLAIYRAENIPVTTQIETIQHTYNVITGGMSIEVNGQEYTMPQAATLYKDTNRALRQEVFEKIVARRLADKEALDNLFNELRDLRHTLAVNADFENYRDYMFDYMGRFDYTVADCRNFHKAIATHIKPVCEAIDHKRQTDLGYDTLRPWDIEVDTQGKAPLVPSESIPKLIEKTIECFNTIDPFFAQCLSQMHQMGHLDLESRKGKAPGGFNYPLYVTGVPFIFMNAANSMRDLVTMVHEGGHAVHSFLSKDLELVDFKSLPSEIAELASMGMELISMEHWDVFFANPDDLRRAKRYQLEKAIGALPWIALVDDFQHWIYENPTHTPQERDAQWVSLCKNYRSSVISWQGYDAALANDWQKQLHIYEVPFYYIEYAIAQLGAIALWRSYKQNPAQTLANYKNALSMGYMRSLPQLYAAAGIEFNFSEAYTKELADFLMAELEQL